MADEKKSRVGSQLVLAVIVALLVGSTQPWWWGRLTGFFPDQTSYDTVQGLYLQHKFLGSCEDAQQLVKQIATHLGNRRAVPESARHTVLNPWPKASPTITDLAADRITRIKMVKADCFQ